MIDYYKQVSSLIGVALGEASMCWSDTPRGVFDSTKCVEVHKELEKEIVQIIEKLQAENAKLRECLSFYADKNSWCSEGGLHKDRLICPDMENMGTYNCGGKRARQCLKELTSE